jgi:predicted transcriptional regulator
MPVDRSQINSVGDLVLTDAEDLGALADPLRLRLFDLVRRQGPASAAALARLAGVDPNGVGRHLDALGSAGLIELDAPDGGEARWSTPAKGIYFEIPTDDGPAQAAARRLSNVMLTTYAELPAAWTRDLEPQLDVAWARAAGLFNARVDLTPDELRDLQDGLERLLEPFTTRAADDLPAGAAPVRMMAFFMPEASGRASG